MASSLTVDYSPQSTAERLIASSRVILGGLFLLAIWLDPSEPSRYASLTYSILAGYAGYAFLLAILVRCSISSGSGLQMATHAVDILAFAILVFLTQGPNSPFFVSFIFVLVCATMRWQWRGTLWTAGVALAIAVAMAWYPLNLLDGRQFELNRLVIRVAYLAVVAMLLGYLGAHEAKLRGVLSRLSASSRSIPSGLAELAQETLEHAARVFEAPRAVLLWEEQDEPWLHMASWSRGEFGYVRESPSAFGTIVAEPLALGCFFCQNVRDAHPVVIHKLDDGLERWQGTPLQLPLQERLAAGAILSVRWKGEKLAGYLLVLDKPHMNADDLMLAEVVAQGAASRFDQVSSLLQLQQTVASDERIRLARDLHDGLLQSLTAAALQLETAQRLIETDPQAARRYIRESQGLIAAEQGGLRSHIQHLKPHAARRPEMGPELAASLDELATRIERHWGLRVEMETSCLACVTHPSFAREIYFLVHESLINAAHHARASSVRAGLSLENSHQLRISIRDNGKGFPFRGRYDLAALDEMHAGPLSLKERTSRLGGSMLIDSSETGSHLEITLPLVELGG